MALLLKIRMKADNSNPPKIKTYDYLLDKFIYPIPLLLADPLLLPLRRRPDLLLFGLPRLLLQQRKPFFLLGSRGDLITKQAKLNGPAKFKQTACAFFCASFLFLALAS